MAGKGAKPCRQASAHPHATCSSMPPLPRGPLCACVRHSHLPVCRALYSTLTLTLALPLTLTLALTLTQSILLVRGLTPDMPGLNFSSHMPRFQEMCAAPA